MSRLYVYGVLLVCIAAVFLGYKRLESTQWRNYTMPANAITRGSERADGETDVATLRRRMLEPYRLVPDRRFIRAIADVDRIIGITDSSEVATEFREGRWWISRGAREVGSLPEFPDFESLDSLLVGWAHMRLGDVRLAMPPGTRRETKAAAALDHLDALWSTRLADDDWRRGHASAALLEQEARSLTWLALETVDRIGTSDPVHARAFAALAVARASGIQGLERETCLLANTMGYYAASRRLGGALPQHDAVRLLVERNGTELKAVTSAKGASTQDRYLYLVHLARTSDFEHWLEWSKGFAGGSATTLDVMATGLAMQTFKAHEPFGTVVLAALAEGLDRSGLVAKVPKPRWDDAELGALIDEFEAVIGGAEDANHGPFFDRELLQSHYRSLFYSALDDIGSHYLESLSSVEATKWFSEAMGDSGAGAGSTFQRWYAHLAAAKSGHPDLGALESDLADHGVFGAPLVFRTLDQISGLLQTGDPRIRRDLRVVAPRLDSRPEQRWELAWNMMMKLQLIAQAERMYGSACDAIEVDEPGLAGWWARYTNDPGRFAALLDDPRLDPEGRATLLALADHDHAMPDDALMRAFEKEIAAAPEDWSVADRYVHYLEDRKQYAKARDVVRTWLARSTRVDGGLTTVIATSVLGRLYDEEGLYADGLRAVGDLEETWQFGAMSTKAFLLYHAGHKDEGLKIAFAAWQRYPDTPHSRMPFVEMLWRCGRYDDAAAALADKRYPLTAPDWSRDVAPKLIECFKGRPDEALKALGPLRARGDLRGSIAAAAAIAASKDGDDRLAFEIVSETKPGGIDELQLMAAAYQYLKKWKGEAEALEWLKGHTPIEARSMVQLFGFQFGCEELAWTLESRPTSDVDDDYLWLMRAAAIERQPVLASHRQELVEHLAQTRGSYYLVAARYLIGEADLRDVLSLANTGKRRCELYYFVGVRAQAEGRLRDASDWYAMSVETGASNNGEWRWAYLQLGEWIAKELSLEVLENRARPRA